jgi:hypothetical protein
MVISWHIGRLPWTLVKEQEFRGLQGFILRRAACIPINSAGGCNSVDRLLLYWAQDPSRTIILCPEGRIDWVPFWRTGFYVLSLATGVPVTYCWMDYQKRVAVREAPLEMTGSPAVDLARAAELLEGARGLDPLKASPIRFRDDWTLDLERLYQQRFAWRSATQGLGRMVSSCEFRNFTGGGL